MVYFVTPSFFRLKDNTYTEHLSSLLQLLKKELRSNVLLSYFLNSRGSRVPPAIGPPTSYVHNVPL